MEFALGNADSAFVYVVKGNKDAPKGRQALPYDKQRLILAHLLAEADSDGEGLSFRGPKIAKRAQALRNKALANDLLAPGAEDVSDSGDELPAAPTKPSAAQKPAATAEKPAADKPRVKRLVPLPLDLTEFRSASALVVESAVGTATYEETWANLSTETETNMSVATAAAFVKADELLLAQALVLVVTGAEPLSTLSRWPAVLTLLSGSVPKAAVPVLDERVLIGDWIAVALTEAADRNLEQPVVTTETTASTSERPTADQAAKCNATIAEWVKDYSASNPDEKTVEDYLMRRLVELQRAA